MTDTRSFSAPRDDHGRPVSLRWCPVLAVADPADAVSVPATPTATVPSVRGTRFTPAT